tara:strand:- start:16 stop:456 length:441 start_codon:yes stop_codon:yes gene_type:complete
MAVQYALVADNGEVQHVISLGADSDYVDGQTYHGLLAKQVSNDIDPQELIETKYYRDGWQTRVARENQWQDWVDYAWVFNSEKFISYVRSERDNKLWLSDWTQVPDSPLSDTDKAEWATYRQALRDVPENYSSATSIDDVVWPTKP